MAGCQDRDTGRGRRESLHRSDSGASPFGRSVCETLQETPEEEEEASSMTYIQQLRSVLGQETAEYFLNPPPIDFQVSPSLQKILDGMEDPLGAEELWRILQEKSKQKLKEECGELSRQETIYALRDFAQRPVMKKVARKYRNLMYIKHTLESHQALTNMLLSDGPFCDIDDSQGLEGPTRYLHWTTEDKI